MSGRSITVSAPAKVHLLGEHSVVYGKPAILTSVGLRLTVTISQGRTIPPELKKLQKIIERIVKKELKLKKVPIYSLEIKSDIPIGSGLGSSAAVSAAYIGALLSYLRVEWNLDLINRLAYEAEKVFHGNPSGAEPATVVFGGLLWYRKEAPDLKLLHPISFTLPQKLSKNFIFINTGIPKYSTKDMVLRFKSLYDKKPKLVNTFLENQEKLVKELLSVVKNADEKQFIRIIREGEKNFESVNLVSKLSQEIIRKIEKKGGAAKMCGAGAPDGPTGILLCYHKNKKVVEKIAKSYNLPYFSTKLGVEGVTIER